MDPILFQETRLPLSCNLMPLCCQPLIGVSISCCRGLTTQARDSIEVAYLPTYGTYLVGTYPVRQRLKDRPSSVFFQESNSMSLQNNEPSVPLAKPRALGLGLLVLTFGSFAIKW